ncbi:MAG: FdtA/QdtA family cupin domain-containing protein [Flavobacteriales bacterium]|jgi:dTDP-4-dehydrorhamnose 3,5-epimerase-like enzyme|nr:FdtA/QdtA family cupin domain-containing protein [Flavobacteriales bacterium]
MKGRTNTIHHCKKITLPKVNNPAGNLTSIQENQEVPFPIERIYYLYDIPGGEERGAHGHKELQQLLVAASGAFEVVLFDGKEQKSVYLNRPYEGLLIEPGMWRELKNFSSGSVCLVLASLKYDEKDYIRDYQEFLDFKDL